MAVLVVLAEDQDQGVRAAVTDRIRHAGGRAVSHRESFAPIDAATVRILAKSRLESVREAVAANTSTPVDVLRILARDSRPPVRRAAAGNSSTPRDLLLVLSSDIDGSVAAEVAEHIHAWIHHDGIGASTIVTLARSKHLCIRVAVARSHDAPEEALLDLARDAATPVRQAVAGNLNTPADVLLGLAGDRMRVSLPQ